MKTLRLIALTALLSNVALVAPRAHAQDAPAPPAIEPAPAPPVAQAAPPPPAPYYPVPPPAPPGYGYGYGYPQQATAQRAALLAELGSVEAELRNAERARARHGIAGPITMMGVGYGTALLFGTVGLVSWSIADHIKHGDFSDYNNRDRYYYGDDDEYDLNDDGVVDKRDERRARRNGRILAGLSAVGAGVGIAGTILLVRQLARRREAAPEIDTLRTRRSDLLRSLRYGGGFSQNGLELTLGGRF